MPTLRTLTDKLRQVLLGHALGRALRRTLRLDLALRFVWQSAPRWTLAALALLVVQGVLPLLSLLLMKQVVDAIAAAMAGGNGATLARVGQLILYTGAVSLLNAAANSAAGLVNQAQSQQVADHMSDVIHAHSLRADLAYYESARYYDTLHRAQREGGYRPLHIVNGLAQLGQNGLSLLAMAGLLLGLHWGVTVVLFLAVLPAGAARLWYAGQGYRWQRERTPDERRAAFFSWMLTGSAHAKEIRLYDLGSTLMQRFSELRSRLREERLRLDARRAAADLAAQALTTVAVFGAYAYIAYRTVQGAITLGDLVMYYQAFQRGQGYLRSTLASLSGLYEDTLFLSNLYEFLDLQPQIAAPPAPAPVPCPMRGGIAFHDVHFGYPGAEEEVLAGVDLELRPGEVVALVGENGAGKTTLIKLLCRLYDPAGGAITLDGVDLRRFDPAALRRQIGVVFQDYVQYYVTARENIWFGNVDLAPDDERIAHAARQAGADEVIARLPHGYETMLGQWFQEGAELSVGEWQKVALARAFVRDAQVLVLDEPTSALDARAEHELFERFRQLVQGRSAILISHRFSTVRMADRIYVLEGGRIAEHGTHQELLRLGGTYARLFEMQAGAYK